MLRINVDLNGEGACEQGIEKTEYGLTFEDIIQTVKEHVVIEELRDDVVQQVAVRLLENPDLSLRETINEVRQKVFKDTNFYGHVKSLDEITVGDTRPLADKLSNSDSLSNIPRADYSTRNCGVCGRQFEPMRKDAQTCSKECSKLWGSQLMKYRRHGHLCARCGRPALPNYKSGCVGHAEEQKSRMSISHAANYILRKKKGVCVRCKNIVGIEDSGSAECN